MVEKHAIDRLKIQGFKSLQDVELELGKLNVLIGPNGAGKSNLVSYFQMLREMVDGRLQVWVAKRGGADRILTLGTKETRQISSLIKIGDIAYEFALGHTDIERLVFTKEMITDHTVGQNEQHLYETGHTEARLRSNIVHGITAEPYIIACYFSILNWKTYHFHDTSDTALVKRSGYIHDNRYLRPDASNLAAYLCMLRRDHKDTYNRIRKIVRLAIPFFSDFVLEPKEIKPDEFTIHLLWHQEDSDYSFLPSQLSDGSLRFICLVTALMQPDPPATIIIDEPEIGLHPYAITLLGALMHEASERMQIIAATQSVSLVNQFSIDDLIVVERKDGASIFKRLHESKFELWLEDYSVGELWEKKRAGRETQLDDPLVHYL